MLIRPAVLNFEKMGFGMFVHFGLYSVHGKGEWAKFCLKIDDETYDAARKQFCPKADWAAELVRTAKDAGCRYITLTTRHHDGYSLYDTCGLNEYDTVHDCGRDLVREFVDACRAGGIVPFFYHTLLDWHEKTYQTDFQAYLRYLRSSVELLCRNYGEIGGFWFDGKWNKPDADWEEDALYGMIRRYQPDTILINNTGLEGRGQLGNIELDSVTFERGKPQPINLADSPKYIASEMCEVTCDHWGYAREDLNIKSPALLIEELCDCRRYGANFLLNAGPMGDGSLRPIDAAALGILGQWTALFGESIHAPRPSGIAVSGRRRDFLLQDGKSYYLFCFGLDMTADEHVALQAAGEADAQFDLPGEVRSAVWFDNGEPLPMVQRDGHVTVSPKPFVYGRSLVVRVAKLELV